MLLNDSSIYCVAFCGGVHRSTELHYGAANNVAIDYRCLDVALPESAMIGLDVLFGGGTLVIHRRFKK